MTETAAPSLDAAQLAEAFALFNRASAELTDAYASLQGQVTQLNERLTVLMTALPAGVLVLDRQGIVVQANRAAQHWLGDAVEGAAWATLGQRLLPTETPGELKLGEGDAARRISLSSTSLESGDGSIVLLHDVTHTHRMQREAERNARLAAMGEMVAGLAHQLRTPLSAALLYTATLGKPQLAETERGRIAERAVERMRHLERLIRDMLLFARGDCLGREPVPVCALTDELTHTLEPIARQREIVFTHACECGTTRLMADRKALAGALTNLLENALQFTPAGGRVSLLATCDARKVTFVVEDTGAGISADQQERLFEPFFTTRAEGTGLGLAIARGVARAHGGDIDLVSHPGEGTRFRLVVPLTAGHTAEENAHE